MKYFDFSEFFSSDVANSCGIDNYPPDSEHKEVRERIMRLVQCVLDPLREYTQSPIIIHSGYRCPSLNRLVGGKEFSQHLKGYAADISVIGWSTRDYRLLVNWAADHLDFDQAIVYAKRKFVHISYVSPEANRHEVLFT